jgi:arginyl-tRNA---protein transferase
MPSAPSTSCLSPRGAASAKLNLCSYDPDYSHWDFGKLSAAREIALAEEGGYDYYYMGTTSPGSSGSTMLKTSGYYIHSCVKMRYKGTFSPSCLLGECTPPYSELKLRWADPENLEWNQLDDDYRRKLDRRKYISPSHDRKHPYLETELKSNATDSVRPDEERKQTTDTTKGRAGMHADDEDLELDEDSSEADDAEIPEGSLFDYNIPGVLSKNEVSRLDLSHWKLLVRTSLIELEVSIISLSALPCAYNRTGPSRLGRIKY